MAKQTKDIAASVRQRLLNLARAEGQLFDVVLVAFGLERLVYRLSVSEYRDRFVLKGGMLVTLWTADTGRFTRDIDFLAFGSDEEAELKTAFSRILAIDGDDGLVYDIESLTAVAIREDQIYGGMRLRTEARLGNTRIPITVRAVQKSSDKQVQNTLSSSRMQQLWKVVVVRQRADSTKLITRSFNLPKWIECSKTARK